MEGEVNTNVETTNAEPSGLPSDVKQAESDANLNTWESALSRNPDYMKQFKGIDDLASKYKSLNEKYSGVMREIKEKETSTAQTQAKQTEQMDAIMSLVPQFMQNNMELTPEMEQTLVEKGIDIRDVKLGAIELRERIGKAHAIVGGQQEYEAMIEWGRTALSPEQQKSFTKDVEGSMSEFAIRGLYGMYKSANVGEPQDRFRGSSAPQSLGGYNSRAELLKDKAYVESAKGRADVKARESYQSRLKNTSDDIIFGRR